MHHIDYGIAVLSAQVFAPYPDDLAFDLVNVYSRLVSEKQMAAYEVKQRFYEILGPPRGLAVLDSILRHRARDDLTMSYSDEHLRETAVKDSKLDATLC